MRCRDGVKREAVYAPHELELMRGLRAQLDDTEVAKWAKDSMMVIHELKSLLPGSEIEE